MFKYLVCIIVCCLFIIKANCQENYGLAFNSFNVSQEYRTSLQIGLSHPVCFSDDMDLSFDFYFIPNRGTYFGYIFRMINNSNQNIDLLYNQKDLVFNTVVGGTFTNINFNIDKDKLYKGWTNIRYHFTSNALSCYINDKLYKTVSIVLKDKCFKILFGENDQHEFSTTDVPPMVLRNISIKENGSLQYHWPLNESNSSDGKLEDSLVGKDATIKNPVWSSDLHTKWRLLKSFVVKGNASVTYNPDAEDLYVVADDSVFRLPVADVMSAVFSIPSKAYHLFQGNQSIYNTVDKKLYNFYVDIKDIAGFDKGKFNPNYPFDTVANTEYGHTNRIFVKDENALYIFGGYGQMRYKNQVQHYDFATKEWKDIKTAGDYYTPRYLAAATQSGNDIYILGGYGSHNGDQLLNPGYQYDLLDYNLKTKSFKKVYSLPDPDSSFVFAGSMYIDSASKSYYALCFNRGKYDTQLRLMKGSLVNPQYEFLGNGIPYSFQDVVSDADLFYSANSNQLIAVTQLVDLNKKTTINIYGIAFPPALYTPKPIFKRNATNYLILCIGLLLLIGIILFVLIKKRKGKFKFVPAAHKEELSEQSNIPVLSDAEYNNRIMVELASKTSFESPTFVIERENPVQIYLFGNFEILDKEGNDISQQFSPLLKELFLNILLNSLRNSKGITSENLNDIFWGNKPNKNAKNNLSVNIVRLKNILSKTNDIHIVKNGEYWMFEYDNKRVSIDLADFLQLRAIYPDEHGHMFLNKMLYFLSRGAFLKQTEYEWLDKIKADINNKIIEELTTEIAFLDQAKESEYILEVSNCIFNFDPLNEEALQYKCKTLDKLGRYSIAKSTYERFIKEYHKSYGEDFSISFTDILK